MSVAVRLSTVAAGALTLLALGGCGGGSAMYAKSVAPPPAEAPTAAYPSPEQATTTAEASDAEDVALFDESAAAPPAKRMVAESARTRAETGGAATGTAPAPPAPSPTGTDATPPSPGANVEAAQGASAGAVVAPMLVYTANLRMGVYEARKALDATEQLARDAGGYLVRRDDTSITVRIPAGRFQGSLEAIMKVGDVLQRDVSVEDVTAKYTDLAIRLRNAEVVRERLEQLLAKANAVKDALEVERELARVTEVIERMKGQLKLLRELVAFSTITVSFEAKPGDHLGSSVHLPFPWLGDLGLGRLLSL